MTNLIMCIDLLAAKLVIIASIVTFVLKKKLSKKWIVWHRVMTVIALVTLILHAMIK
ncbi:MAG: hypothetical protein HY818_10820 [Acetobacterium woodii]|nr:hypothetical protein [Acetobacterium woodii]